MYIGTCQKFADLGPLARDAAMEDLYSLGFVFLSLVLASYSEDSTASRATRALLGYDEPTSINIFTKAEEIDNTQISAEDLQKLFETICNSEFQSIRSYIRYFTF
jgi:hypothetical protein